MRLIHASIRSGEGEVIPARISPGKVASTGKGTRSGTAAQGNPTLCKIFVAPARKFTAALTGLVGKAKSGGIDPSDVDGASGALTDLHNAATQGGADFTDNANASVG